MAGKPKDEKTFWERFNESFENQKRLVESTDYFDWLYEFTKKYPKFTDTDWLYDRESISESDYSQVELLTDFFMAIEQYHRKNLIGANSEGCATWYNIKYKDAYFAIGIRVGQGAQNFVTRYKRYQEMIPDPYVEFEVILGNKECLSLEEKNKALLRLYVVANDLRTMGVPREIIENTIKQVFDKKNNP